MAYIECLGGSGGGSSSDGLAGFNPDDYTTYLESFGEQYINTNYIIKDNTRIDVVFERKVSSKAWDVLFGVRKGNGATSASQACYIMDRYSSSDTLHYGWATNDSAFNISANNYYFRKSKLSLSKGNIMITNGDIVEAITFSAGSVTKEFPLWIYGLNISNTAVDTYHGLSLSKIYSFKIFEDNSLVMDFVPYEDNGVACLKDKISGNLFYNQGSGDFVYGTDE